MVKKFLLSLMLFAHLSLFADASQADASQVKSIEKQRWEYMKNQNWKDLENQLAPYFQMAFYDGALDKEQFMQQAKSANLSDYTLSAFKITTGPGIAVVTYDVNISETIEGKRITSNAGRLSVWKNDNGKWLLVAHSVLIPVPSSTTSK